jgi:hypothetical protein
VLRKLFVNTGVRQGAIAYTVLFNFAIDWVMQKAVAKCALQNHSVGISLLIWKKSDTGFRSRTYDKVCREHLEMGLLTFYMKISKMQET